MLYREILANFVRESLAYLEKLWDCDIMSMLEVK